MNAQEAKIALDHVTRLQCPRADDAGPAGIWQISLPWPAAAPRPLRFGNHPTYVAQLGRWPGHADPAPRRMLLCADGCTTAPDALSIVEGETPDKPKPDIRMERFAASNEEGFKWERHLLRIESGASSIGLAMGLRTAGEVHWWEACRLVVLETTPFCTVVQMGGAIPHRLNSIEEIKKNPGYAHPFLHRHNWINADLFVRVYANGVCEVFAHHINSKVFDNGLDLEDTVPVIGFHTTAAADAQRLVGAWDGSQSALTLGSVKFDVTEAARLATAKQPGRMDLADGFLAWQPYLGAELYGGLCPKQLINDEFIFHAENKLFPRGMARTIRFSFSLGDRSPRIARYVAPYWWYGVNCEITPQSHLPVAVDEFDQRLDYIRQWFREYSVDRGFEDGSVPRGAFGDAERHEPGWEGEIPYAQFLLAWRSADATDYRWAMRSAYHFTDVVIDHAANLARMHGYPPIAYAPPMNRVLGCIAAYLETGDPYLFNTAEAVTEAAHRLHFNAWPRLAVGRDACYLRGAVMLYRFFNNDHFRRIAHEGAMTVVHSQRDNGSFGDQGGGTGVHQWGGYITKPWMALLATGGVLDYLELFPDDKPLRDCIRRLGDWLMKNRWNRDGYTGWSYQHEYDGKPKHIDISRAGWWTLPTRDAWHQDSLGRVLGYCTMETGDPAFLDAFMESFRHIARLKAENPIKGVGHDHFASCAVQFLPRLAANLHRATLTDTGVSAAPYPFAVPGTVIAPQ